MSDADTPRWKAVLTTLVFRTPGGDEHKGISGQTSTRGDSRFIAMLGRAYLAYQWVQVALP